MHRAAPLHPIFVHFTIALVGTSFLFDTVGCIYNVSSLLSAAWWTMAAAIPITVVTVATGIVSRRHVAIAEGIALRYLRVHVALGPTFFGCLIAVAVWRAMFWNRAISPTVWYLVALGVVTLLMTVQGCIGGELVYAFGIGVRGGHARLPVNRNADCSGAP
jgi:uncharacterized membrane protein